MAAWLNSEDSYGALSISLHWFMLVLLVAVVATMELREYLPRDSELRALLKAWHYTFGLSVGALLTIRLGARLAGAQPAISPPVPVWQHQIARLIHLALYVVMAGMPLIGWAILSAEDKPVGFWGLELPALAPVDKSLAHTLEEVHEIGATLGYWLVGLHAVAALWHHYVQRDNTLIRMLPLR